MPAVGLPVSSPAQHHSRELQVQVSRDMWVLLQWENSLVFKCLEIHATKADHRIPVPALRPDAFTLLADAENHLNMGKSVLQISKY